MSNILYQMNSVTRPAAKAGMPVRQIKNYFFLITNMMKLGLQLIWEQKHGLKYFDGISNVPAARMLYDEIVRCVMQPEQEESRHFQPQEIDVIAEKLAKPGLKTQAALDYLKTVITLRMESEDLQGDGDTHTPLGWVTPITDDSDVIEFRRDHV